MSLTKEQLEQRLTEVNQHLSAEIQRRIEKEGLTSGFSNGIPIRESKRTFTKEAFVKTHLYGLPLEKVQELIKEHYPEYAI